MIGLIAVIALFTIALIGPYIAPYPYYQQVSRRCWQMAASRSGREPGTHPGDGPIGRDLFSRLLAGDKSACRSRSSSRSW